MGVPASACFKILMIKLSEYLDVFIENLLKSRLFDFLLLNSIIFREDYQTLEQQTDGQKRRKENERRKYFLGGVVLKYSQFLKDNYLFGPHDSEEAILRHLLEDFIVCNYLSDVTNDDENKANNVRNSIKNKRSEIIEKIRNLSKDIEHDKRG